MDFKMAVYHFILQQMLFNCCHWFVIFHCRFVNHTANLTYLDYKTLASEYQLAWKQLLLAFKSWSQKSDELLKFLPNK